MLWASTRAASVEGHGREPAPRVARQGAAAGPAALRGETDSASADRCVAEGDRSPDFLGPTGLANGALGRVLDAPPRKEREFHASLLGLTDAALADRVAAVLGESRPRAEQVALLRVLLERRHPAAPAAFVRAVTHLPGASGAAGESVPRTAVRLLCAQADRQPVAREILECIAWDVDPPSPSDVRCTAVAALIAHGAPDELPRLAPALLGEVDPAVRQVAWEALSGHPDVEYASWLRSEMNCEAAPRPELDVVSE